MPIIERFQEHQEYQGTDATLANLGQTRTEGNDLFISNRHFEPDYWMPKLEILWGPAAQQFPLGSDTHEEIAIFVLSPEAETSSRQDQEAVKKVSHVQITRTPLPEWMFFSVSIRMLEDGKVQHNYFDAMIRAITIDQATKSVSFWHSKVRTIDPANEPPLRLFAKAFADGRVEVPIY